ncbi:MAG: hypothetical protein RR522_01805 [Alistipes sp.]
MKLLITIAALLAAGAGMAQHAPTVRAHITPDSIAIGDRFDYVIEVEKDQVQVVNFPEFRDASGAIELVESFPVDTLERNGRAQKLRKRYTLAAFEEGNLSLGRAQVLYADKNVVDTLRLRVATFEIDTTKQTINDLKGQKMLPFRYGEVSSYVNWALMALVLLLVLFYVAKRLVAHYGLSIGDLFKPTPPLPPHVAAIRALEALHNQKLWQNDRCKQYYSALTDILRTYLAARYHFGAMEMTSDEIIDALRGVEDVPQKSAMDLTTILRNADPVKFAKATPDAEQNEADYLKAYYFVEETKEVTEEEKEKSEIDHEQAE